MYVEPFVKWVGGKRHFVDYLSWNMPKQYKRYYEPFVGGGALFFKLLPENAVLSDINHDLINAYICVRDNVLDVMELLDEHDSCIKRRGGEYYYKARDKFNQGIISNATGVEQAALFIFINKHCFNGIYRVNSGGLMNIAYNDSVADSFSEDNLLRASVALKKTDIRCCDFQDICEEVNEGDFVFLDSPYVPLKSTSIAQYAAEGFSLENHLRVANIFHALTKRGVYCITMNYDTELIRMLYPGTKIDELCGKRVISHSDSAEIYKELLIKNY